MLRRPSPSGLLARLPARTVRLRLTLLYGALFTVSGAVLLTITYLLVSRSTNHLFVVRSTLPGPVGRPAAGLSRIPPQFQARADQVRLLAERQHAAQLHELLVQSAVALAIMTAVSIALGWLVAGRALRPLRTMTTTIRHISARNVHERLAVAGPRDELKDLADTVDGLLGRLEHALDAQRRFVANAAHELRTPLTLQRALLEETAMDRGATAGTFRATFERLLAISEQQGDLLESLLTLAGSERGLDRREPADLSALAERALRVPRPGVNPARPSRPDEPGGPGGSGVTGRSGRPGEPGRTGGQGEHAESGGPGRSGGSDAPGVPVRPGRLGEPVGRAESGGSDAPDDPAGSGGPAVEVVAAPAPVCGDPALLERLIANLLDNAVRYNVPGGRVEVRTGTSAGRAVLTVINTGPVIPPEQAVRLFEPFQRLGRTARDDGHHGLGLSIVRAIAVAHGATVRAHARREGGLAVEIAFPACSSA